jgi:hypothetical protein
MANRTLAAAGAVVLLACDERGLGSRIEYEISQAARGSPGTGGVGVGGLSGSCTRDSIISYVEAQSLKWAPGTRLDVTAYWPDRTDCSGLWRPICPAVIYEMTPVDPAVWAVERTGEPSATIPLSMQALGAGLGGFTIRVDGARFEPDVALTVDTPTAIRFERATAVYPDGVVPSPITELDIPAGQEAAVAVTMRNAAGEHLCGAVPAAVAISGNAFSLGRVVDVDYVNMPYRVIAGPVPGAGSIQFTVGEIRASLSVVVRGATAVVGPAR